MQLKLLLFTFYLNGGLHAVSIGKPPERGVLWFSDIPLLVWTVWFFFKANANRISIFCTSLAKRRLTSVLYTTPAPSTCCNSRNLCIKPPLWRESSSNTQKFPRIPKVGAKIPGYGSPWGLKGTIDCFVQGFLLVFNSNCRLPPLTWPASDQRPTNNNVTTRSIAICAAH